MKQYGFKSALIKLKNRGLCYCIDCWGDELRHRKCIKLHRKRARRLAKKEIQNQLNYE